MKWLAIAVALAVAGCSIAVDAVHPHPSVSLSGDIAGKFMIDTTEIPDTYDPSSRVHITHFRESLANGLQAAFGDRFATSPDPSATHLVFTEMSMSLSSMAGGAQFLLLRFRVKWLASDGHLLAEVSGTASPANPAEPGPRHVEDAIEVMYTQLVDGLDRALHPGAAPRR